MEWRHLSSNHFCTEPSKGRSVWATDRSTRSEPAVEKPYTGVSAAGRCGGPTIAAAHDTVSSACSLPAATAGKTAFSAALPCRSTRSGVTDSRSQAGTPTPNATGIQPFVNRREHGNNSRRTLQRASSTKSALGVLTPWWPFVLPECGDAQVRGHRTSHDSRGKTDWPCRLA